MSTNGMSAAQLLQQAHDKPLTEDPFPVDKALFASNGAKEEGEAAPASSSAQSTSWQPKKAQQQPANVNLDDDQAFPSLSTAAPASNKGSTSKWGQQSTSALRSRLAASEPASQQSGQASRGTSVAGDEVPSRSSLATLTASIPTSDVHIPAPSSTQQQPRQKGTFSNERHSEPTSLGDVMKLLMKKYCNVTIEASTSRQLTNFILKAKGTQKVSADDLLEQVRRELLGRLSKKVSIQLPVPTSLRAVIIGSKGRNLKQIIEETGANIQIPNKEASEDEQSPKPQVDEDDEVGPMVAITISGPSSSVSLARERIMAIVADRTSKTSVKLDNIPTELWPLLNGAKGARMNELLESVQASELVNVFVPRLHDRRGVSVTDDAEEEHEEKEAKAITLSGDKDAINRVVEAIESRVEDLKRNSKTLSINVNKRQHRFLVGQNAEEVLEATGCCVILPPAESPSEEVFIRGPSEMLPQALGLVMAKANAQPVESLDLLSAHRGNHDKRAYAAQLTRYVLRRSKFRPISEQNGVQIYMPRPAALESGSPAIEIVGKSAESVAKARQAIIELVRGLPPSNFSVVEIDSLVHKHLIGKKGSKIKTFEDKYSVETVFPADGEDRPDILIVYAGEPANAKATLDAAKQELESLAKDAADLTTVTLTIPSILHRSIIGQGGTTLNAILGVGDERLAHVTFGSSATSSTSKGAGATNGSAKGKEDEVSIRGPSEEVERVKQEIERIAEQAKNDEIVNSHTVEFEVERSVVRHIVGKQGSGINKLREDLGVKVDIEELAATSTSSSKQKPDAGLKSKVTIRGRKENVEEAKRRVSQQAEKLADETTLTIPLPDSLERGALIGKQGTYLKRLENSYEVRINFPRDSRKADDDEDDEPQRSNEITIRGPKKGAEQARKELVDLIDYEREHGHTASFTVSSKALPRVLGKGGASINEIKDETGVSVDTSRDEDGDQVSVTLKGTRKGVQEAKQRILTIAQEVDNEARLTLTIPREYHTNLIGAGGSNIKEIMRRAGGPSDPRAAGQVVRFPGRDDTGDTVTITAPKELAEKVKAEIEKEVSELKSRVVHGVVVPQAAHAALIGRGASNLQDLQRRHNIRVLMPGRNDHANAGEPVNKADLSSASADEIVKLVGSKDAVEAAAEEIVSKHKAAAPTAARFSITVEVPRKLHATIAQQGKFFRALPAGTRVSHDGHTPPSTSLQLDSESAETKTGAAQAARIDEATDDPANDLDAEDAEALGVSLKVLEMPGANEEGTIPWVIGSRTEQDAQRVKEQIEKALESAQSAQTDAATRCGLVTVPRSLMPRIIGRQGSGLEMLRTFDVQVEVVGRKDANQLTLIGLPDNIQKAYSSIVSLAKRPARSARD